MSYPSDLTDMEWKRVKPILDRFQFVKHDPRDLLNAMFYVVTGGTQWRMLPESFPPWQTVYYHFRLLPFSKVATNGTLPEAL